MFRITNLNYKMIHFKIIFKLFTIVCLILLLISCKKESAKPQKVIRPVRFQQVSIKKGGLVRTFSGTTQAGIESKLSFKVSGTVQQLAVKVGDKVKKGDVIAELDSTDYELQVQKIQASLTSARAEERNASANYKRVRQLYENQNASRNDLDAARANAESKKATVRSIEKQLELARQQRAYTQLKSPLECVIAKIDIEESENVQTGQQVILTTCGTQTEAEVSVPESIISRIQKGSPVTVTLDSLPGKTFSAIITEVGVSATGTATTFPVKVQLLRPNPNVRTGMSASVTFTFESEDSKKSIFVPLVAVGEDHHGQFVFLIETIEKNLGVVHRKSVKVGELNPDGLEIIEGLKDGDLIVTAGISRLEDGSQVKLIESKEKRP
jgi:RND family efflux transporter MFP subunit